MFMMLAKLLMIIPILLIINQQAEIVRSLAEVYIMVPREVVLPDRQVLQQDRAAEIMINLPEAAAQEVQVLQGVVVQEVGTLPEVLEVVPEAIVLPDHQEVAVDLRLRVPVLNLQEVAPREGQDNLAHK